MRTRFIATDYCTAATTAGGGRPLPTLDFVQLHLPHLPPPNYPSFAANFLNLLDDVPVFYFSLEIEKLPIDDALSIFLSDVLPHFINRATDSERGRIDYSRENFEDHLSQKSPKICYHEKELDRLGADGVESEKKDGKISNEVLQFEIPETDTSLLPSQKCATSSLMESLHIFSEISDAECAMDVVGSERRLYDELQIQHLVFSVDHITVEYPTEGTACMLTDSGSVGEHHSQDIKFPLFEVVEESLGVVGRLYVGDELLTSENVYGQKLDQPDIVSDNELLASLDVDLMKYLLHPCAEKQNREDTNISLQLDNARLVELPNVQEYSAFQNGKEDKDLICSLDSLMFDENLFVDLDFYILNDVFSDAAEKIEVVACESMFAKAMNFKSFDELIVCHELTLMDNTFKSLPAPIFSDAGNIISLHSLKEDVFVQLDWQSSSASDGLYLDWDYLTEDDGYLVKFPSCWKMLSEIESYKIDVTVNLDDRENLIFEFILSEAKSDEKLAENYKEVLKLPVLNSFSSEADSNILKNNGDRKMMNEEHLLRTSVEKVPVFGESMSSDLEFFLNPRNYITGRKSSTSDKSVDKNTMSQARMSSGDSESAYNTTADQQKGSIKLYQVKLSDNVLLLIDHLGKNFLALLKDEKELLQLPHQYKNLNEWTLLHIPKENLMSRLNEKIAASTYLAHKNDDIMVLAMLCAIKQMAFYLCYFGIQATYSYMNKLNRELQCMKSRLSALCDLIRNEQEKAENQLSIIHPSISIVQDILQANSGNTSKILIVSDQVFWHPLKRLMASLKITYNEPQHSGGEITDNAMDVIVCSNCCLLSHDYLSPRFPFSKFSCILEYGGSNGSSKISSICPNLDGLPTIYFVKVDLGESTIAKALIHGVDMPNELAVKRNPDCASGLQENNLNLEELLNSRPDEENHQNEPVELEVANKNDTCNMIPIPLMPLGSESKENRSCETFLPNTIIIVNTQNVNDEMIISRRSTYRRILEMEKDAVQVVERDITLPVDVIVSTAICITWYNCRNIGKKASAPDEAFSCLPLCVESIAANILTSLSFSFSCCVLIFEGEDNFLGSIMESSDELYAAAASLGIDIQVFCSCSSEMTEGIILSCINVATKSNRGLYPKMLDSESLGEYFLTAFPSINPLAAHAILSTGDVLGKFLEMSNECKIHALKQYQIPNESVSLLSATIRYGEREDSKSGVTDCSSSLSSIPDSENFQLRDKSDIKKPKYSHNLCTDAEPPNDLFLMGSLNLLPDDKPNPPKLSVSGNSCLFGRTKISDKPGQFNSSFNDNIFSHSHEFDGKVSEISDEREKSWMPSIDLDCSPRWRSMPASTNNFGRKNMKVTGTPQDGFIGEVIDIEDSPPSKEKLSIFNSGTLSPFLLEVEKDYAARNSRRSKLTPGANSLPAFTHPIDFGSVEDAWNSRKDKGEISREETKHQVAAIDRNNTPMNFRKVLQEEDMIEMCPARSYRPFFQEKGTQGSGGTPLSNALYSTQLQQGSPWTIEFLNRVREKSRLRKQSASCNLSSPCLGPGNTANITKRKSPSMIEFYKYGGNTPSKVVQKKRQKRSSTPLKLPKNDNAAASRPQSCTPVDKRARRTLSFSTNGTGGQSKLVWMDDNSPGRLRRF